MDLFPIYMFFFLLSSTFKTQDASDGKEAPLPKFSEYVTNAAHCTLMRWCET